MVTYTDVRDYFKDLAISNKKIKHLENSSTKKFFEFSVQEVVFGSMNDLPGFDHGPFMIYSGFIDTVTNIQGDRTRQLMLFIQMGAGDKHWVEQNTAKNETLIVCEEILSRMRHDSIDDASPVLNQSFNRLDSVKIIPNEIKLGGKIYLGWQLSFTLVNEPIKCYDQNDWL